MIDYIFGTIEELNPARIVVDNQGIGYGIEISLQTYESLQNQEKVKLYIYESINQRDGSQVMYGFYSKDERSLFELIIGVSGIGASSARMILSSISSDELKEAIIAENISKIKSIKGIGLKSAQRLILELKDKIIKGDNIDYSNITITDNSAIIEEASSALSILGFSKQNINKAIQNIIKQNPNAKVEEIIKMALKIL